MNDRQPVLRIPGWVKRKAQGQHLTDQKGVMGPKASGQRLPQRRELSAQRAARQVGQDVGIAGALREGVEHGATGDPEDITGHRRQLDARAVASVEQGSRTRAAIRASTRSRGRFRWAAKSVGSPNFRAVPMTAATWP
jgi:hypothetical protein